LLRADFGFFSPIDCGYPLGRMRVELSQGAGWLQNWGGPPVLWGGDGRGGRGAEPGLFFGRGREGGRGGGGGGGKSLPGNPDSSDWGLGRFTQRGDLKNGARAQGMGRGRAIIGGKRGGGFL